MELSQLAKLSNPETHDNVEFLSDIISSEYSRLSDELNNLWNKEFFDRNLDCHVNKNKYCRIANISKYSVHNKREYILPIFQSNYSKVIFLPDLLKLVIHTNSRMLVLFDDDNHRWPSDGDVVKNMNLNVSDLSIDMVVESEISNKSGEIVFTWIRIALPTLASSCSNSFPSPPSHHRCGILRISKTCFPDICPPSYHIWNRISDVFSRSMSEIQMAYDGNNRVVLVDTGAYLGQFSTNPEYQQYGCTTGLWGHGPRSALFMGLDVVNLTLHEALDSSATAPPPLSMSPSLLPSDLHISHASLTIDLSQPLTPTEDNGSEMESKIHDMISDIAIGVSGVYDQIDGASVGGSGFGGESSPCGTKSDGNDVATFEIQFDSSAAPTNGGAGAAFWLEEYHRLCERSEDAITTLHTEKSSKEYQHFLDLKKSEASDRLKTRLLQKKLEKSKTNKLVGMADCSPLPRAPAADSPSAHWSSRRAGSGPAPPFAPPLVSASVLLPPPPPSSSRVTDVDQNTYGPGRCLPVRIAKWSEAPDAGGAAGRGGGLEVSLLSLMESFWVVSKSLFVTRSQYYFLYAVSASKLFITNNKDSIPPSTVL